jgi:hypothetical protein
MTPYKCYKIQMQVTTTELLAPSIASAILAAQELYPGQEILSVLLQPEWEDCDD